MEIEDPDHHFKPTVYTSYTTKKTGDDSIMINEMEE